MNIGDSVTIWDGEGDIGKPSSWLIGIIVKTRKVSNKSAGGYQVSWNKFPTDPTWYSENDIHIRNLEGRFK